MAQSVLAKSRRASSNIEQWSDARELFTIEFFEKQASDRELCLTLSTHFYVQNRLLVACTTN